MFATWRFCWTVGVVFLALTVQADVPRYHLHGHVPAVVNRLTANGLLPETNELQLAIGLPLRNQSAMGELMRQLYDPGSTNFHKFLTPSEFTAGFGPALADYQALEDFARTNGLKVVYEHGNRLVLEVRGRVADIQRAFHVTLRTYHHPTENRDFFAPDAEPSVPAGLSVADIWGISDYWVARPMYHDAAQLRTHPLNGTGPLGYYAGSDLRNAYIPGVPLNGAGQSVASLQFSSFKLGNITNYEHMVGYTNPVNVSTILISGYGNLSSSGNEETCLDIEMAISMAPQLANVYVYEIGSTVPSAILSRMANDNLAKQLSCSWTWSGGPDATVDSALMQMILQGQSFFQASGDSDAYTGPQALDNVNLIDSPVDSTNLTAVGGTTLTTSSTDGSWSSEQVWNYNPYGGQFLNEGSGGGVSLYYTLPAWQAAVNTNVSQGSGSFRNIPDVAMLADGVDVVYSSGRSSVTNGAAGTSCAAPMWAGFCALMNQQAAAVGSPAVGFINPAIYRLAQTTNYANAFHDITAGNNIGTNTPNEFNAANGYDLCTGLGTPNGLALVSALVPAPGILVPPASETVNAGANVTLSALVAGASPQYFQWRLNSTNLPAGGNVSGVNSSALSITSVTANNGGNYSLVYTNPYGAVTSAVAVLTVVQPPVFITQPTNLTQLAGSTAVFTANVSGSTPIIYHWQRDNTNLINGANTSGVATNTLTLSNISSNNAGNYTLVLSNAMGTNVSSVASLTVLYPPAITASSLTNQTIQCGSNVSYSITISGTTPLSVQWSLDAVPIPGATGTSLSLTNIHLPSHTVSVVVTNLYASVASNAVLTVQDTLPPVVTLNGLSRMTNVYGVPFVDPGATAYDQCAGNVPVLTNGVVNINAIGTNTLTYSATDGNGNTGSVARAVVVVPRPVTLGLLSATNPDGYLASITFKASVTPTNATGTIAFATNGAAFDTESLIAGSATSKSTAALPRGTNLITAIYSGDAADYPATNSLSQIVTNHPPTLVSPLTFRVVAGRDLTVLLTNLATNWSDVDGDALSLTGLTTSTNGITVIVTNPPPALFYADTNYVNDQFTCQVTDGYGGTNTEVINILIQPQTNSTPNISRPVVSSTGVTLTLGGAYNSTYVLESTTNLSGAWTPLATNQLGITGTWQFTDGSFSSNPRRFYRLELVP